MTSLISNPKVFVFDVRDQNEVDGGHIDAKNINHIPARVDFTLDQSLWFLYQNSEINLEKLDEIDEALLLSKQNYELIYELNKPADSDEVSFALY